MANVLPVFSQNKEPVNMDGKRCFEEIVQFVLSNGGRKTYCNMYNNNPYYSFDNVEIYLDPYNQRINFFDDKLSYTVSDYNEILIEDNNGKRYFRIRLLGEKVYMRNIHTDASNLLAEKILRKYLYRMTK